MRRRRAADILPRGRIVSDSAQTRKRLSLSISTGIGVLVPQVTAEYLHEFQDPQRKIKFAFAQDLNRTKFRFENDRPDRNYFNLGLGVVAVLPHGFSPFVNYRALLGYDDQSSHAVAAGLRIEF